MKKARIVVWLGLLMVLATFYCKGSTNSPSPPPTPPQAPLLSPYVGPEYPYDVVSKATLNNAHIRTADIAGFVTVSSGGTPRPIDLTVRINSGQTLHLTRGNKYYYTNLVVDSGGTIKINDVGITSNACLTSIICTNLTMLAGSSLIVDKFYPTNISGSSYSLTFPSENPTSGDSSIDMFGPGIGGYGGPFGTGGITGNQCGGGGDGGYDYANFPGTALTYLQSANAPGYFTGSWNGTAGFAFNDTLDNNNLHGGQGGAAFSGQGFINPSSYGFFGDSYFSGEGGPNYYPPPDNPLNAGPSWQVLYYPLNTGYYSGVRGGTMNGIAGQNFPLLTGIARPAFSLEAAAQGGGGALGGYSAGALFILVLDTLTLQANIDISGEAGYAGGNGGSIDPRQALYMENNLPITPKVYAGHGGGGGGGGAGGGLAIKYEHLGTTNYVLNASGGAGGLGGAGGTANIQLYYPGVGQTNNNFNFENGQPGDNGSSGSPGNLIFQKIAHL